MSAKRKAVEKAHLHWMLLVDGVYVCECGERRDRQGLKLPERHLSVVPNDPEMDEAGSQSEERSRLAREPGAIPVGASRALPPGRTVASDGRQNPSGHAE